LKGNLGFSWKEWKSTVKKVRSWSEVGSVLLKQSVREVDGETREKRKEGVLKYIFKSAIAEREIKDYLQSTIVNTGS